MMKPNSYKIKENFTKSEERLFLAALMLYWGEGAKTQGTVDIANSDPNVSKVFLKFLREICQVDEKKLRFYLYCFDDQDVEGLISFWMKELKVPRNAFTKPYIRKYVPGKFKRRMAYGVLHVRYNDKKLLEKILSLCSDLMADLSA